jgi:hypothetical protein
MTKKFINILILLILIGFSNSKIFAQDSITRKAFISVNTGCYFPTGNDFNKIYGDFIFINGLSIGIPFTNQDLYLYGKAMYFVKEGTPIIYHFTSNNGISSTYTIQEGLITIKHFLFNLGLQYNFKLNDNIKFITNGGLTLIKSTEKSDNPVKYDSNGGGLSGLFLGLGLEKKFSTIPLSLFTECQFNPSFTILKTYNLDYSAINFNIGLRYYFNQSTK